MKKLLIALGALLVLAAAALLVGPQLVDWNGQRDRVAAVLAAATGRNVAIAPDGQVAFRMLPRPMLALEGVTLAHADAVDRPLAEIGRLDLRVAPLPLLRGEIRMESLTLVAPHLTVEAAPDGTLRWPVEPGALGGPVRLDRLVLEGGTLRLPLAGGTRELTGVSGELTAGGPEGPYHVQGGFMLGGLPLSLDLSTGRLGEGGAVSARAALTLPGGKSALRFAGAVNRAAGRLQGELRAEGERLAELADFARAAGLEPPLPLPPDQPFALRGTLTAEAAGLTIDGADLRVGESRATGSLEWRPAEGQREAEGRLVLAFPLLDLDSWPAPAATPAVPAGRFGFDLLADQVRLKGGVLRDARLVGATAGGVATIEGAGATLPGGGPLALAGTIRQQENRAVADLQLETSTDDARALLSWLGMDVSRVAPERLRRATLAGRLTGHAGSFQLSGLKASLDTSTLTGALSVSRPAGTEGRTGIGLRAAVDRLDLDAYLPADWLARREDGTPGWAAAARAADLNLDVTIGQATILGLPFQGLALAGGTGPEGIALRMLKAEGAAGVAVTASGRISGPWPVTDSHLTLTAAAETLAPLFRALGTEPPLPPERLGAVKLSLRLAGDAARLAVEGEAGLAGGTLQVGGSLAALDAAPELALKLRGTFPEAATAFRLLLPDWRPGTGKLGAFDGYAELNGPWSNLRIGAIQAMLGDSPVRGEAALDRTGPVPKLTANLDTGPLDLDLLAPDMVSPGWEGRPWAVGWLHGLEGGLSLTAQALAARGETLDRAKLTARFGGGTLTLERMESGWRGGRLVASGSLSRPLPPAPDAPPGPAEASLRIELAGVGLPERAEGARGLDLSGGRADLVLEGKGSGADPDAIAGSFVGAGRLSLTDTALTGMGLEALSATLPAGRARAQTALNAAFGAGRTPLDGATAEVTVDNGAWKLAGLAAEGPAGKLTGGGTVDLAADAADLALTVALAEPEGAPLFTVALAGPLDRPGRSLDAKALVDWSAAKAEPPALPPPPVPKVESAKPPAAKPAPKPAAAAKAVPPKAPEPPPRGAVDGILERLRQ
ncbi:MAG TPA: AsmA family protein [Azospirillaceae bacterium]|nr:AsmA family protein [Azospirillaceae bacterium]